jgi:hypothetical protein
VRVPCAVRSVQGSVLGPYDDDLEVEGGVSDLDTFIVKLSDDTKGQQEIQPESDRITMQTALDLLNAWQVKWGMVFNVGKCKAMRVGQHSMST